MTETTRDKFLDIERLGVAVLDLPADLWGCMEGGGAFAKTVENEMIACVDCRRRLLHHDTDAPIIITAPTASIGRCHVKTAIDCCILSSTLSIHRSG
jgi:hypothetical protein